jgi:hypothetical protein
MVLGHGQNIAIGREHAPSVIMSSARRAFVSVSMTVAASVCKRNPDPFTFKCFVPHFWKHFVIKFL